MFLPLQAAVPADVVERETARSEYAADKESTMAVLRALLAAQHRDAKPLNAAGQALDADHERLRRGDAVVSDVAVLVVERIIPWPTAKFIAQEQVAHPYSAQLALENLSVVVGGVPRSGHGPDIDDDIDAVLCEQLQKALARVVGVPDREEVTANSAVLECDPFSGHVFSVREQVCEFVEHVALPGWASRYGGQSGERPVGDIDVLVLGDPARDQLYKTLADVEKKLGRQVQATIREKDWLATGSGTFHETIKSRPMLRLDL